MSLVALPHGYCPKLSIIIKFNVGSRAVFIWEIVETEG